MFRRSLPLLCACVLAGCRDGDRLEDFSNRVLVIQVTPLMDDSEFEFNARLAKDDPETGCLRLDSGVTATLNGEPVQVFQGGQSPDPDGPCGSPPMAPAFILRGNAARFAGGPRDALLEVRDGGARIVAEYRNLLARHTLARPEVPLTVKPGQEVFLAWDPPTDELSEGVTVSLDRVRIVKSTPEPGGVRITFPADLPAGPMKVWAQPISTPRVPSVRCEGVKSCTVLITAGRPEKQEVEVFIQP
ncbi:hypothetical protein P2318_04650 [Myxococcaceae bacterium GXIMD 01537]